MSPQDKSAQHNGKGKEIDYFVNGEKEETEEKKLAASVILGNAGFTPAADWILSRDENGKTFAGDDMVTIHKDERFTAKHKAPTPTS